MLGFGQLDGDKNVLAWEKGCAGDYVRNSIVIPQLDNILASSRISSIMDIGCATGYIARTLINRRKSSSTTWIFLDRSPDMLTFAKSALRNSVTASFVQADIRDPSLKGRVAPVDLAFSVFTTLEFPITDAVAANMAGFVAPKGMLVIFLPDMLGDVILAARGHQDLELIEMYMNGHCSLDKIDRFTGQACSFHATRIEFAIANFLDAGLKLTGIKKFLRADKSGQDYIFRLDFVNTLQ